MPKTEQTDQEKAIDVRNTKYSDYASKMAPRSKWFPSVLWAFLIGGVICIIGEALYLAFKEIFPNYTPELIGALVAVTLVTTAAILTGFGLYDRIGHFAGGGSVVPITGFSNAIASSAIEHRKEGIIFGTCANMFKVAGPVIVVGVALSMLVGLVYYIISLF